MEEMGTPIYLLTGFLESGKTRFINFTMQQEYFNDGERTLLIVCEEGLEEYEPAKLAKYNTVMEVVESEEEFTAEYLARLDEKYHPERVLLEYNGMWRMAKLLEMELPGDWEIYQAITTIDASTFDLYLANMKSMAMDLVSNSELVIFNRCDKDTKMASYRRSIKAVNPRAEVVFETADGEPLDISEDLPFDVEAPVIELEDIDYGIWYIDAMDNPEKYDGKTLKFTAMAMKPRKLPAGMFIPGRKAMTCCADDVTFLGYICKSKDAASLKNRQWITVTARVKYEYSPAYRDKGPVLYAEAIEPAQMPQEELVYFN